MKVSAHCYAITGLAFVPPWSVNSGFVVGEQITLVVDTGANMLSAQTIHGYASNIRPGNILQVINTERHLDHVGGNSYFRERESDIYGHYKIARKDEDLVGAIDEFNACITNSARREKQEARVFYVGTRIANPTIPITTETQLDLGGLEAHILLTAGHTQTNISIYIPDDNVLFAGDCLLNGYLPNLEEGMAEDWRIWLTSLDKIEAVAPAVVIPGHGNVLRGEQITEEIRQTQEVLETALRIGRAPTPNYCCVGALLVA